MSQSNLRYVVTGMTCDHCAASVRQALAGVAGVDGVELELASGRLTVSGGAFSDEAVHGAVAEAGYEVVA